MDAVFSDALNPRSLRRRQWWLAASALAVVVTLGALLSSVVGVVGTAVSPIYLPLGIGVAVLARGGRSLWPGFVVGDAVGLLLTVDRSLPMIALSVVMHATILLVGAWLIRRERAWLEDLGGAVRFVALALGLSITGALLGLVVLWLSDGFGSAYGPFGDLMVWLMGDLGGYLVAGGLLLAWLRPGARAELRRGSALVGFAVVCLVSVGNIVGHTPVIGVLGLLGAGLMAMRFGTRWGSASAAVMLLALLVDAARNTGDFGGVTPDADAFNAMLAVAITASASLLLGGYREGVPMAPPTAALVVGIMAATMVGGGVATFASSRLTLDRGFPLATASIFFLASASALALVRGARTPSPASTRRGIGIAVVAGALSVAGLALYFASLPQLGVGSATGLSMTAPAFIVLIAAGLTRRLPPLLTIAGCSAIAVGAVAIAVAGGGGDAIGIPLAIGGAVAFAAFVTLLAVALRQAHPVDVAVTVALTASVVGAILALIVEGREGFAVSLPALGIIAFGAIGGGALPTLVRAWSLPAIGAPVVGALGVLSPVTTIVFAMLLLGTDRSPLKVAGVTIIAVGAATAALAPILVRERAR
jgi:drug/metabolite transporter (DMT)-like permease/integral membrane sensor domain MASE1